MIFFQTRVFSLIVNLRFLFYSRGKNMGARTLRNDTIPPEFTALPESASSPQETVSSTT